MPSTLQPVAAVQNADPIWLTVRQAADRAQCGPKVIYRAVAARHLKAAAIGGRRELRFRAEWIDSWLEACSAPVEGTPRP
jgi:excisionase family DNA binding protein